MVDIPATANLGLPIATYGHVALATTVRDSLQALDKIVSLASASGKRPCRVATTANHSLSGLSAVDGVTLSDGDRVLVWKQTDSTENGIYVASNSAWVRSLDFDKTYAIARGTTTRVNEGTLHAGLFFVLQSNDNPVVGTDSITFSPISNPDVGNYGAKFDGSDDSAAVAKAIAVCGVAYIPAGKICSVASEVVLSKDEHKIWVDGSLKAILPFTGSALVKAAAASGYISRFDIYGAGVLDCSLNTTTGDGISYGVHVVQGRFGSIRDLRILGAKIHGVYVGSSVAATSYEVHCENVHPFLHEVQTGTPYTNDAASIGIYYKNVSDSLISGSNPVGYRVGMKADGSSVEFEQCHPWTRYLYHGPMDVGIWLNGPGVKATDCYADTPINGTNEVYCFRVSKKGCRIDSPLGFNNNDYGTDGNLVGILLEQGGESDFVCTNPRWSSSENQNFRFKAYYKFANNPDMRAVRITGHISDSCVVDKSTDRDYVRFGAKDIKTFDDGFLSLGLNTNMWAVNLGTNGSCSATVTEGGKGLLRLNTGADAAGTMAVNGVQVNGPLSFKPADGTIRLATSFVMSSNGNVAICLGLSDIRTASPTAPVMPFTINSSDVPVKDASVSNAVALAFDSTSATDKIMACGVKAGTVATTQNSNVAPSASTYRQLEIFVFADGSAQFFVDGVATGGVMANAVDPTAVLCPSITMLSRSASAKTADIDFFTLRQDLA